MLSLLRRTLRPELLNRIDEIVIFASLTKAEIKQIVALELEKVAARLAEREISITYGDDVLEYLSKLGYEPEFGARPLKRAIKRQVTQPLAESILKGVFQTGDLIRLTISDDKLAMEKGRVKAGKRS